MNTGQTLSPQTPFPETPRYSPLRDYAIIGDTLTAALISRRGSLDWMCLPNFDSGSVFASILDANRGGRFFVGPAGEAKSTRSYAGRSLVLVTRHETADGTFEVTDFMPLTLEQDRTGLRAQREIVRRIRVLSGRPVVSVRFAPRPDYGTLPELRKRGPSVWTGATGRESLILKSDIPLEDAGIADLQSDIRLDEGARYDIVLAYTKNHVNILPPGASRLDAMQSATRRFWEHYASDLAYDGSFQEAVMRSAIILRLLTFSQSGAVLAAPSTGLPEAIGGGRNWDYRYCWLRDASFVMHSFSSLGLKTAGAAFFRWLMHATQLSAPHLKTLYTVFGRTNIRDGIQPRFEGYRRSAPVHVGNGAETQLQLDAYGSVLQAALVHIQGGGKLTRAEETRLVGFAKVVCRDWSLPDNGLWERPGPRQHYTYSKAMCWAALDALIQLEDAGHVNAETTLFKQVRATIRADILSQAWNEEKGAFAGAYGADWLDASVLLFPRFGLLAADDPRMVSTYEAIQAELGHGAQLKRYRDGLDGFPSTEGTFTVCGFWAADYLARRGDIRGAEDRVQALLDASNDLGLMSEELDPDDGTMLGNFPQGFSHAGLIGACLAIEQAKSEQRTV